MLLPGSLSETRKANATTDIRRNLRLIDPEEHAEYDPERQWVPTTLYPTSEHFHNQQLYAHGGKVLLQNRMNELAGW